MKRVLIACVLVFVLFSYPSTVIADVAPPEQPSGPNIQPGNEGTQVSMEYELVVIKVAANTPTNSLGVAQVSTSFDMRNLGTQSETIPVRFPIAADDGWGNINEIQNVTVKVAGQSVASKRITGTDPSFGSETVPWAEFTVTFPPAQDVNIQVNYTLQASGEYPFIWFSYIFSTGAGWKGKIGSADLIVELPYAATPLNVMLPDDDGFPNTLANGVLWGNDVIWNHVNFEPTQNDNLGIDLVAPSAWQKVLKYQQIVAKSPKDGESWGDLAKAYKLLVFSPKAGFGRESAETPDFWTRELYELSRQAYENAVTLKPDDPLWHAGYADLLAEYAYWGHYSLDTRAEAQEAMRQIQIARRLAPKDSTVQQIAAEIANDFPEGMMQNGAAYDYPWLTATPTLEPTSTPTPESAAATEFPTPTP